MQKRHLCKIEWELVRSFPRKNISIKAEHLKLSVMFLLAVVSMLKNIFRQVRPFQLSMSCKCRQIEQLFTDVCAFSSWCPCFPLRGVSKSQEKRLSFPSVPNERTVTQLPERHHV